MWDYSEKVKEHFYNPKNAGAIVNANGTGDVGSISCGDALRLTLNIDPDTDIILDAGFQTFGCGSAIASSSALTEMVKGKTTTEALAITNQDIADFLDGLPPEKMHCSVMGREALQAAIANYRGEEWLDDHEEGALICKCFAVDDVMIRDTVRANNLSTVEDVTNYTKAGGGCNSCQEGIERILREELLARGEVFNPAPISRKKKSKKAAEPVVFATAPGAAGLTVVQKIRRIEEVLELLRPTLRADKGDVELVDVVGNTVYVNLIGACTNCQLAAVTLGGIQQKLIEAMGEFIRVVPASEREAMVQLAGV